MSIQGQPQAAGPDVDRALPEGWEWVALGDLLDGIDAGANFRCVERPPREDETGVVKISAVTWGTFDELESKTCPQGVEVDPQTLIRPGDFLISRANTIQLVGACVIVRSITKRLALSDKVLRLRIAGALPQWVLYCLRSRWGRSEIERLATGNQESMRNIGQDRIRSIRIPLPPLSEQRRIVTEVEALLARASAARIGLAKVPAILKRFRQSVLDAAASGRLTEDWRALQGNLESADVLFERIQSEHGPAKRSHTSDPAELPPIPEEWKWVSFGSVIGELRNGIFATAPNPEPPGNPILRISAGRQGRVILGDFRYLPNSGHLLERYRIQDGDLLFTRYNGSLDLLGVCGMVRGLTDRVLLYPDKLIRVRFDTPWVLPAYVEAFFGSPGARERMTARAKSSAGQQGVSGADIKLQPLALPPIAEQREIVRRVEALFALADTVERRVQAATARADALTQSILARAFRGELVPTEAELTRQEGRDYEPAAVLLERAQRARTAQPSRRNGRHRASADQLALLGEQ